MGIDAEFFLENSSVTQRILSVIKSGRNINRILINNIQGTLVLKQSMSAIIFFNILDQTVISTIRLQHNLINRFDMSTRLESM